MLDSTAEIKLLKDKLEEIRDNNKAIQHLLASIVRAKGELFLGNLENGNINTYTISLDDQDMQIINPNLMKDGDVVIERDLYNRVWVIGYKERKI